MIHLDVIAIILFMHWVGDFLFQSQEIAQKKSKSIHALLEHVVIYSIVVFMFSWLLLFDLTGTIFFVSINLMLHLGVDFVTSKRTAEAWERKETHKFFVIIGLDQMIHYMILFGTYLIIR